MVLVVLASPAVYGILECALRELHEILEDKIEMEDVGGGAGAGGRRRCVQKEGERGADSKWRVFGVESASRK